MTWNDTTLGTYGPWFQTLRWGTWHLADHEARGTHIVGWWPAACGSDYVYGGIDQEPAPPFSRCCQRCWAKWQRQQAWERAEEATG